MTHLIKKSILVFLVLTDSLFSSDAFIALSVPKAGTFLLKVVLENITLMNSCVAGSPQDFDELFFKTFTDPEVFVIAHPELEIVKQLKDKVANKSFLPKKLIIIIRDLRDAIVSGVDFVNNRNVFFWPGLESFISQEIWNNMNRKEQMALLIRFHSSPRDPHYQTYSNSIKEIVQLFGDDVYITRFENLVGEKGKGNDSLQITELENIARFLEVPLTKERAEKIASEIFADSRSSTFFQGIVGRWKSEFDSEIKEIFKEELGEVLIDWGYEQNHNW